MSTPSDSILNKNLTSFLAGDRRAGGALFIQARGFIFAAIHARSSALRQDRNDILDEVFVLMLEAPTRFDPTRGSARNFIVSALVPEAIRRIRAKAARPGTTTRLHREELKPVFSLSTILDPLPNADLIPSAGYGSPQAIEAACDAHVIWERATPPMKLILGGLLEGKTQNEIAAEAGMDRFRVIRMITGLQRQFAAAA